MSRDVRSLFLPAAGVVVLATLAAVVFFSQHREPESPVKSETAREIVPPPLARPPITDHPSVAKAEEFLAPEFDAERDLEILETLLGDFARAFGENPVGENEEITATLQGNNPKGLRFFPTEHRGLSGEGKLLDRWGTPWFFHALSGKSMEIISAGPDREFGTDDDSRSTGGR